MSSSVAAGTVTDGRVHARLDGVEKIFGAGDDQVLAVTGVDLEIRRGEILTLLGPSGCGKSTLFSLIAGLDHPTSGSISIDGASVDEPRRDVGMMLQRPALFPWRTTLQNVLLPVSVMGLRVKDYRDRAEELIEMVGLKDFIKAYPQQLSGGMQQRVALCRVLITDPELILLDEPFGALDEFTREAMDLEVLRLWEMSPKTIVLVTHSITEAVFMSDRIAVMSPRPGRVSGVVDIDLPRPRTSSLITTPEFSSYTQQARDILGIG